MESGGEAANSEGQQEERFWAFPTRPPACPVKRRSATFWSAALHGASALSHMRSTYPQRRVHESLTAVNGFGRRSVLLPVEMDPNIYLDVNFFISFFNCK